MTGWSRRAVLGAGALGALAGCSSQRSPSKPGAGPTAATPTISTSHTASPGGRVPWAGLRRSVGGALHRPGDPSYDRLRLLQNPRYDEQRPLALLAVSSAEDVAAGLAFAREHDLPVAVRSGGHSYPGWSGGGVPRALVIDVRPLADVRLNGAVATIGAGATLARVYEGVGGRGRAVAGGSCSTVGIAGLALGGGVGMLTRAMGLTCDAVRSVEIVTADGAVRTADPEEEPDLFWALRGGGGGHLGVVTSFDFETAVAPTLHTVYLTWPFRAAADVVAAWQGWAPTADERLWSTLKLLGGQQHAAEPSLVVSGAWAGPATALDRQLTGLLDHVPRPSVRSVRTRGYLQTMRAFGGTGRRGAFSATSHVMYDELAGSGIDELLDRVRAAQGTGLQEAGVSLDALGGRAAEPSPTDTAFVHRTALATVQYTATYPPGSAREADDYVGAFRRAMRPHWGDHAYVNYADPTIEDYRSAYFGANTARLAQVRAAYDPDGFFTQPQDF